VSAAARHAKVAHIRQRIFDGEPCCTLRLHTARDLTAQERRSRGIAVWRKVRTVVAWRQEPGRNRDL